MMKHCLFFGFLFSAVFIYQSAHGQTDVFIDGEFTDWQGSPAIYSDPSGDGGSSNIDFGQYWMSDNSDFIFFHIEVGQEINLQEGNAITFYVDTDNDPLTGETIHGIGADLSYTFGERMGTVYIGASNQQLYHDDIHLISAPTVSSDHFECAIKRNLAFLGQNLFTGDSIRVVLRDNASNGDLLPDAQGGIVYAFSNTAPQPLPSYSLAAPNADELRMLSYNVLRDGLFESDQAPAMFRLLQAVSPKIIGFQEIYNHTSAQVSALIETVLPSATNEQWYHAKQRPDIITLSRYPILSSYEIDNNGAFLLDLTADFGHHMLLIVAHPPCCSNNTGRQQEIDAMMGFIRDAKAGTGLLQLPINTPIVILGDMNLVGFRQQLNTLLNGNIINEPIYGVDFHPDWDSTDFADARPPVTEMPMNFTWFNEGSSFSPGRLDFIIYSDSQLELRNSFTLFTRFLPQDTLNVYGLQQTDAETASDHLPVVSDFFFKDSSVSTAMASPLGDGFMLEQNQPNPFAFSTTILYRIAKASDVKLSVYNLRGETIRTLVNDYQSAGSYAVEFSAGELAAGVYFFSIQAGNRVVTKKMMIGKE